MMKTILYYKTLCFLMCVIGVSFLCQGVSFFWLAKVSAETASCIQQTEIKTAENTELLNDLNYIKKNKTAISDAWRILSSGIPGPQSAKEVLSAFVEKKIQVDATKTQREYEFKSTKTEFQRFSSAVASLETKYPLVQIKALRMSLPPKALPFSENPTYLDVSGTLYMPVATSKVTSN